MVVISIEPLRYKVDIESECRTIQHEHKLLGESFVLEKHKDKVVLSHKDWSIYAEGENLLDAECKLIQEAKELSEVFLEIPASSLDLNALNMREFLFKVI